MGTAEMCAGDYECVNLPGKLPQFGTVRAITCKHNATVLGFEAVGQGLQRWFHVAHARRGYPPRPGFRNRSWRYIPCQNVRRQAG